MDNLTYTARVDKGDWPDDPSVPLDAAFEDDRGLIQNLVLRPVTSTTVITSRAGTTRANHYHKTDWHYSYVVSGRILYFERPVGSTVIPTPLTFSAGSLFFTPPLKEHCMVFVEPTVFFTMAKNVRSHESHEDDVVRVQFITPDLLREVMRTHA
jgi:hypothetical protein